MVIQDASASVSGRLSPASFRSAMNIELEFDEEDHEDEVAGPLHR